MAATAAIDSISTTNPGSIQDTMKHHWTQIMQIDLYMAAIDSKYGCNGCNWLYIYYKSTVDVKPDKIQCMQIIYFFENNRAK